MLTKLARAPKNTHKNFRWCSKRELAENFSSMHGRITMCTAHTLSMPKRNNGNHVCRSKIEKYLFQIRLILCIGMCASRMVQSCSLANINSPSSKMFAIQMLFISSCILTNKANFILLILSAMHLHWFNVIEFRVKTNAQHSLVFTSCRYPKFRLLFFFRQWTIPQYQRKSDAAYFSL